MEQNERRLRINGTWTTTRASTMAALLGSLGIDLTRPGTAVAVNESVVPRARWAETALRDGDSVEIIRATQGG